MLQGKQQGTFMPELGSWLVAQQPTHSKAFFLSITRASSALGCIVFNLQMPFRTGIKTLCNDFSMQARTKIPMWISRKVAKPFV
jgi:hypothetical protein